MSYDDTWDLPHAPGTQALWQESDCYWYYDTEQRVGGFHRLGQHPNLDIGQVMLFAFAKSGPRYRSVKRYPVSRQCRTEIGQRVGSSQTEFLGDGRVRWSWNEPECEGELTFERGFYKPRNWSTQGHGQEVLGKINPDGHLECSGVLSGRLRIGPSTFALNALAHRDRSWGPRDHNVLGQHRMFSGTVGPEFSIASFMMQTRDGSRHSSGFVVRNGKQDDIVDLRIPATIDDDGHTTLGATAHLSLQSGEVLDIEAKAVQGFLTNVEDICFSSDTISTIKYGGRTGFVDLEVTNNPMRGAILPRQKEFSYVAVEEGISPSAAYQR